MLVMSVVARPSSLKFLASLSIDKLDLNFFLDYALQADQNTMEYFYIILIEV